MEDSNSNNNYYSSNNGDSNNNDQYSSPTLDVILENSKVSKKYVKEVVQQQVVIEPGENYIAIENVSFSGAVPFLIVEANTTGSVYPKKAYPVPQNNNWPESNALVLINDESYGTAHFDANQKAVISSDVERQIAIGITQRENVESSVRVTRTITARIQNNQVAPLDTCIRFYIGRTDIKSVQGAVVEGNTYIFCIEKGMKEASFSYTIEVLAPKSVIRIE